MLHYLQYARLVGAVTLLQAAPITVTQHRINELAAKCITAQQAMSGLKGTKKPGETQDQYCIRIKSYLNAIEAVKQALNGVKQAPALTHATLENERLWKEIAANVGKLDRDVHDVHEAWATVPKVGDKARLGPRLLVALNTVQAILTGLRDARP